MISGLTIEENAYLPLRDVVFQTLRQAILKGELQPGERLMEIKLAERLGVSRTPIREAIRKLELEGLVVMIPRKGAAVANITEKDTKDVLEVRRTLEMFAVEVACDRITPEQLVQLKEAAKAFEASNGSMDLIRIAETDMHFHEIIYEATHNERLVQMLNNLRENMYRYRIEYLKDPNYYNSLVAEHQEILDAVENGDKERARVCMRDHIDNQQLAVISKIK
ncbi:MAG: GntR family transcriptional regulator [Lachnospiraceae bacterium]|nr:GntR family transcriptional regulator [Lachnospiraceae bacterium]